jgi:exopolysaccharide biosynthesis WecB/TagA/CpsF family protein
MMITSGVESALRVQPALRRSSSEPMLFGHIRITETSSFPPASVSLCWTYVTLNAEIALSLQHSAALRGLLASPRARVSVDGQWLWWGLRWKYPEQPLRKLPGSDLIHVIAEHCARSGQRLLLLGSSPRANAGAVRRLRKRWPELEVVGYSPPRYEMDHSSEQVMRSESLAAIEAWRPDFIVLGLGAAKEHRFAWQTAAALDGKVTGLMCFGGAIDLASGQVKRAPLLWQRVGLEGIYRVLQQPKRLHRFFKVLKVLPVLVFGKY